MTPHLLGLGAAGLEAEIDGFLLRAPNPGSSEVADFLKLYPKGEARDEVARTLVVKGVRPEAVASALTWLDASGRVDWTRVVGVLSVVSMGLGAYHGYRRNQSLGWAIWWGLMGGVFPVFTPVVAFAQGFGKRKG